jgi:hypothetical protein
MLFKTRCAGRVLALAVGLVAIGESPAHAGRPFSRRARVTPAQRVVPTNYANSNAPTPMLGTFYPTPYMTVRGNAPAGGGYSPLGVYGDQTLALYGPISPLRATTAPVLTYSRGYDGSLYPTMATGFSTPILPSASPVIYPTQATNYYGFRESGTPPWWKSGLNWIDQN